MHVYCNLPVKNSFKFLWCTYLYLLTITLSILVGLYHTDTPCVVDAGEIQGQLEWPGSLVESGSQEQCSAERSRHCEGLLEEGKLPEFQVTMKLENLEFYAFVMSPSIQRWENERNLIF